MKFIEKQFIWNDKCNRVERDDKQQIEQEVQIGTYSISMEHTGVVRTK